MSAEQYVESASRIALEAAKQILAALNIELGEIFLDMEVTENNSVSESANAAESASADEAAASGMIPESLASEIASVQSQIDGLQARIDSLQEQMWGPDTPEGRELAEKESFLAGYEHKLNALQVDITNAVTIEEREAALDQVRTWVGILREQCGIIDERLTSLEPA